MGTTGSRSIRLVAIVLAVVGATNLGAQISVDTAIDGNALPGWHGAAVSNAGDMNGDGYDDFIIGAPKHIVAGGPLPIARIGRASAYSGADGSVLYDFLGTNASDQTGYAVSGAGDVDNDGFMDVIVGTPEFELPFVYGPGHAIVYSGQTGGIIRFHTGPQFGIGFGASLSGLGDLNGDGFDEVVIGSPFSSQNGTLSGTITVISGIDSSILFSRHGGGASYELGFEVANAGDVNADGINDVIAGGPQASIVGANSGIVQVFSGADGSVLYTLNGTAAFESFGFDVSGAGDVDRDGHDDFMVLRGGIGDVLVYSGADGSLLFHLNQNPGASSLISSISSAGDTDGDGHPDMIFGFKDDDTPTILNSGKAVIYSGKTGFSIRTLFGDSANSNFGAAVSRAGDVNGDGFADVLVGAPFSALGAGRVVVSPSPTLPILNYSSENLKSTLNLDWNDLGLSPTSSVGILTCAGATPNAFGQYAVSLAPGDVPILGIRVLVAVDTVLNLIETGSFGFNSAGMFASRVISLHHPAIAGAQVYVQYFEISPTIAASNGIRLLMQ